MYVTGPHPGAAARADGVHLVGAARMLFSGSADFLAEIGHRVETGRYFSDLVRPHAVALAESAFDGMAVSRELGQSYGEMAEALIAAAVPPDWPVDVLVLAFAIHDVRPGRATATYLSHVCPGRPFAFAICDQGVAAAFTGLRLVREYLTAGQCRRALLLVVEQAALPYAVPASALLPGRNAGVALVCTGEADVDGPGRASARAQVVRVHTTIAPGQVRGLLEAGLAELAGGRHDALVILGASLAEHGPLPDHRVLFASRAQPYTGLWWELAGTLTGVGNPTRLVLADYEPGHGYLCFAAVDHG